ncbi:MAG TPA: peptidase C39 family protein [Nocardioides sp.]|uniref:peptidase C39 family protein n=1 Tax=Nocardioides sp. TaxID=35761 RepID=UPI002D7EEC9B|nr:peptidase C39 family protein [Nocardioides sp.]HET6653685.1 peptidase C39 family protein [Nocardioides sp.]
MRIGAALTSLTLAATTLVTPVLAAASPAARTATPREIAYTSWDTTSDFAAGTSRAVRVVRGRVRLDAPTTTARVAGATYEKGSWTSPWTAPGFGLTELVPSWDAKTPEGTFVQVQARGRTADGRRSSWDGLGRWASGDDQFRRRSLGAQTDDLGRVATDTWVAASPMTEWQLRVTLHRRSGTRPSPKVDVAGAVASALPSTTSVATSRPGVARGVVLPVPQLSQMVHQGHYPAYGGGGEAWCSPTSTAMVLGYYGAQPTPDETAWVGGHDDRVVDHVARMTFDHRYDGTGNWPFNTAYAATRTDKAFVTRFGSLRGVERMVKAGIPVVTSLTFGAGQLAGAPISSTNGHLLVVVGFTAEGDVVVNDPAASSNAGVRRTYDRGQFENAWLKRGPAGGSGGIGYVIHDKAHPLPARASATSW